MKHRLGFTLIELLVVISIIGILAAFSYVSFLNSQLSARDTQRRSDINQYKIALEQYANNNNGAYRVYNSGWANLATQICSTIGMSICPTDPVTPNIYRYISDASGTEYKMYARLESATNTYWIVCSAGKSGSWQSASAPAANTTCEI
jgi:prepilin-type N-terminal cleavage/methylation domain-containing protein